MANKRIDELTAATPLVTDFLPATPTGGPSTKATVPQVVLAGLSQPNSAASGAGANITIKAADGVTSGAGGNIVITPGLQAATGGDGVVIVRKPSGVAGVDEAQIYHDGSNLYVTNMDTSLASNGVTLKTGAGYGITVNNSGGGAYSYLSASGGTLYVGYGSTVHFSFWTVNGGTGDLSPNGQAYALRFPNTGGFTGNLGSVATVRVVDSAQNGGSLAFTHSDINLTGITDAAAFTGSGYQRITGGTVLNGILPPSGGAHVSGRMIKIVNTLGSAITVANESTSVATVGNRLKTPTGASINLGANHMLQCIYDTVDSRWRVWMTS